MQEQQDFSGCNFDPCIHLYCATFWALDYFIGQRQAQIGGVIMAAAIDNDYFPLLS